MNFDKSQKNPQERLQGIKERAKIEKALAESAETVSYRQFNYITSTLWLIARIEQLELDLDTGLRILDANWDRVGITKLQYLEIKQYFNNGDSLTTDPMEKK